LIPTPKQYNKGPLENIIATTEHIHKMFLDAMHVTIWQKIKINEQDHNSTRSTSTVNIQSTTSMTSKYKININILDKKRALTG